MLEAVALTAGAVVTVFGWAFFSFWSSIPAGIALNLAPVLVALTATVSYAAGAALVVLVGAPLRDRVRRRIEARQPVNGDRAAPNRMLTLVRAGWDRFGLVGLSLLAPMTVGAQTGAVIGLSFGVRPLPLVIGLTLGAAAWSIGITLAVVLGVMAVS